MRAPWSFLTAAAVIALLSCQAIVTSDVPGFTCTPGIPNTCPKDHYCFGAGCVPCVQNDPCDGYDNNCNGTVDETSDSDKDGFTSCGQLVEGEVVNRDCDESDTSINPSAPEVCNGRDDNCNGQIDEGVCPEGQKCAPKSGQCVPVAQDCTSSPICVPPLVCDPGTLSCVNQNQALGAACSGDASCRTGLCGDERMLTRRVIEKTKASVCTKGCCTSKDCDANFVCFGAGTGGSYCVHHQHLGRVVPGLKVPGERCAADGDCRSSKCGPDKTCLDTCCSGADCTNGTQCAAIKFDGHDAFTCTPSVATQDANSSCTSDASCKSNLCYTYQVGFGAYDRCVAPCCGAKSCSTVTMGVYGEFKLFCNNDRVASGDVLASCSFATQTATGGKQIGDECNDFTECATHRCNQFGTKRYCTDVCCTDADCPREKGFACRATQVRLENTPYSVLRCVPVQ